MSQSYQFIKLERLGAQATLILNRPPLNVLHIPMMEEMIQALTEVRAEQEIRLLLIRGEGRCFSAGMDVADHLHHRVRSMFGTLRQLLQILMELEIPTISAIHGAALGGGLEVAVITDLTYAAAGCKIGQPEINLGVFPPLAIAYFSRLIGTRNAYDLILSGRTVMPEEALRMGLVNGVFSSDDFNERINEITATFLTHSKAVLAVAKRALRETDPGLFDRLNSAERIYMEELMSTEDALEGLEAFLEKRQPVWRHR